MEYSIEEHKHRLAAWDAAASAAASPVCRFKVQTGAKILEDCGFTAMQFGLNQIPPIDRLDRTHMAWRKNIIAKAAKEGLVFSHGIAAKLINCYLKARFVCGGHHHDRRVQSLHPPIDAVLLDALAANNFGGHAKAWRQFKNKRWSKYDSITYQSVIDLVRQVLPPRTPLWKIEEHWKGFQ